MATGWAQGLFGKKTPTATPVVLHIYDLGTQFAGVNAVCKAIGTGAFHAGVEVYQTEWSYGGSCNGPTNTGIFSCPPRGCEAHSYREAIDMGTTTMSRQEVNKLISKLKVEWTGHQYDLLRHNCCHFCEALCLNLGVGPVPGWVTSLAGVGAMLRSNVRNAIEDVAAVPMLAAQGMKAVANLFQPDSRETLARPEPMKPAAPGAESGYPKEKRDGRSAAGSRYDGSPISPASAASRASGGSRQEDAFAIGDAIEIYSHSRKMWCKGEVKSVELNSSPPYLETVFWVPGSTEMGTGEMATKKVPLGSKDVRKLQNAEAKVAKGESWSVGDWIEVFSNSKASWCLGRITQVFPDKVRVVYQLPGSSGDDWMEKELLFGSTDLRRAEAPQAAVEAKPQWSKTEEAAYREEFAKLLPFSTGKSTLDSDPLAEYLKTCGLPRKVLKQIWIASVKSATQADFDDFACCCRLIAHCQIALANGDAATIEVMEQAGEQLRQLLREKFLDKSPSKMPEFGKT